ncbi:hypothetical protein KSD_18910 [Ktedonobacter sp. SOSP1-85]|uniref:hypothetical protein n=1 Tax=Ktedonobacter sp. SOSP1-85 TaxID=2778367 RepID=UPI0019164DE8|nr:hypothetical protein [Ktedonobacter sp. SOSP1-85]GHO74120.1 hypothetical protein KSD_18910 [Ktedonobacter sp. SOSP1-85]
MGYEPNSPGPNSATNGHARIKRFGARLRPSEIEQQLFQEQGVQVQREETIPGFYEPSGAPGIPPQGMVWCGQVEPGYGTSLDSPLPGNYGSWDFSPEKAFPQAAPSPAPSFPPVPEFNPTPEPLYVPQNIAYSRSEARQPSISPPPLTPLTSSAVPPSPWGQKKKKPLLLGLLLGVLLLGGLSYYVYSYMHIAHQINTPKGQVVTPTVNAQATALASAYPFSKDLVLTDTLKDNSQKHGWQEDRYCTFAAGAYQAREPEANTYYTCPALKTAFTNFTYQLTMRITKGEIAGLTFRGDDVGYKYYAFIFNSNGSYTLLVYTGRNVPPRSLYTGSSSQFKPGADNQIAIAATGSTLRLFANHQLLASVEDATLTQGQIGVAVYTQKNETQALFRDAKVWKLA